MEQAERTALLQDAERLINGDRNLQYGAPIDDFTVTAQMWESYLCRTMETRNVEAPTIEPHDVAVLLILVKISRLAQTPEKRDHWLDIAGYAGCGWECVTETHLS